MIIRYSDNPVDVGQIVYCGDGNGGVACHVVTATAGGALGARRVYDAEERSHVISYAYAVRKATEAEEDAYLALPRPQAYSYRVLG